MYDHVTTINSSREKAKEHSPYPSSTPQQSMLLMQTCPLSHCRKHPHAQPLSTQYFDMPGICAGCGERILDRYYLEVMDRHWHQSCLTCSECNFRLESEVTCFTRDGKVYCKTDYCRRFGPKYCMRCRRGISSDELIIRAKNNIYHLNCFSCCCCNRNLKSGDHYFIKNGYLFCSKACSLIDESGYDVCKVSPGLNRKVSSRSTSMLMPAICNNNMAAVLKGTDNSNKPHYELDIRTYPYKICRQKRVRTSFKQHQISAMKSYFEISQNPDCKDLRQLAQRTGLSQRVLQVWFQNARAKYRRNLYKQEHLNIGAKSGQGYISIPQQTLNQAVKTDNYFFCVTKASSVLYDSKSLSDIRPAITDNIL